jgi:ubiquinone/menaquinone biosynthesis C-methylase UbiE
MSLDNRITLERNYHESEEFLRDQSRLIVGVYQSGVFDEAETYLLEALGDIQDLNVLDYGCGTGKSTQELKSRGALVTAFDISLTRLKDAKGHLTSEDRSHTKFVAAAAERLPFIDKKFDAIIGKQILHHLELEVAAREISRVLKPGGKAVFLEPLIHNPFLEAYRRLTPHLRSPTERALSVHDLREFSSQFTHWEHTEFCFFAILPVLVDVFLGNKVSLRRLTKTLQRLDQTLIKAVPSIGRYYWETVVTFWK